MSIHFKLVRVFLGIICFLWVQVAVFSQSAKELERRKLENIEKLNYSKDLLEKTGRNRITTINQLNLLTKSVELRTMIIEDISFEIEILKRSMDENKMEISKINRKIEDIKKNYAKLIVTAARNLENENALIYLYSSEDLNQIYQRIKYIKYMTTYRKKLVEDLQIEMNTLLLMNNQLEKNKNKNELLLKEKKIELQELEKDKNKSAGIVNELKRQEVSLKKEIEKQESIQREIENQIKKIIEEEAAKAAKAGKALTLTPEEKLISVEFIKNMGKLPWPSDNGIVTGKYGEQNHPVLKGIKINNNGIDVSTAENTKIRSVFNGEVTKVVAILGANYTVIIKHGEYRTVYQNLVNVKVKSGDKVYAKSEIGTVYTDPENTAKYHFEVWKGKEKTEDPEIWLSK